MEKPTSLNGRFPIEEKDGYDAVVVGSGYGGSVAACRMSMAGIKVCLTEKGRRWEARDFPTNSVQILSAFRMQSQHLGVSFGPRDALYQVHLNDDSLAAVPCGLGGGSLINAGVMLPTPSRARKNPKWPKEWESDWDTCQANAAAMLRIQTIPTKFPIARVMEKITDGDIEETCKSSMKLSVNFEGPLSSSPKLLKMDSCKACGNCVVGCPYNAKSSTDKNYLFSAIQAGCVVKTECEVKYIVQNPYDYFGENRNVQRRRWRVYFNEIDFLTSDFVIVSAGVFGTTKILFQSQMRGLQLSERLGSGFSSNGNNAAYIAGSPALLGAYGLHSKEFSKIPFEERPGPSISSSYTSSLGFTIQSAVLPTVYRNMIFKGIATYVWPTGYGFFHGTVDRLKRIIGLKFSQAMVLNVMGYDESDGKITFRENKLCFTPSSDPLLPRKVEAFQKLAKKLGGILFMSRYRSTSVHHLGGCNASRDFSGGVCNPNGQVFDPTVPETVHPGLYVCDASIIPCSIGINPSLTIATAAEHVSKHLVQDVLCYKNEKCVDTAFKSVDRNTTSKKLKNGQGSMVVFKEIMRGHMGGMPCTAYLKMKMYHQNQEFDEMNQGFGHPHPLLSGKVGGYVELQAIDKDKLQVIDGEANLCKVDSRTPYTQYMHYRLLLAASSGSRYVLEGRKIMNPYLFAFHAWKETTTLHVTFKKLGENSSMDKMVDLKGQLRVSLVELLRTLISFEGSGKGRFIRLLSQTFLRTYIMQMPRGSHKNFTPSNSSAKPYPNSVLHEIRTGDGCVISCRQWKCNQKPLTVKQDKQPYPVLLLNGHTTESFYLPTEPADLVRTLLDEGRETWLIQSRLHPQNPSNNFTIEDIGQFDIPSVINKILDLHGMSTKVHVIAHCVGGLAIHVALLGGHVSATHLASLSCTNSSMFFKLCAWSRLKMRLPLIPISMAILGKNRCLPLLDSSKVSTRHRILKSIARLIPRYERCTGVECEVFSGIFGNTFWHENVSPAMHNWLNRKSTTKLPMAAFPHLRKICNSGFIVDSKGNNSYLIHPERMSLPTLYLSGGRTLLVTPETSFLANKYMKLHQPGFRHERVVVDGFGHSDLLIGEESCRKVFPHILAHIRLSEQEGNAVVGVKERKYNREVLDWGADPYEETYREPSNWLFFSVIIGLFLLVFVMFFSSY